MFALYFMVKTCKTHGFPVQIFPSTNPFLVTSPAVSPIGPGPLGWASLPGRCSALVPTPRPRWRRLAELLAEEKNGGLHHGKIAVYGGLMHLNMKNHG